MQTKSFQNTQLFWFFSGLVLVACMGILDILTGSELAFSLFYLIPIILITWFAGKKIGLVICGASAIMWFAADVLAGQAYTLPIIRYWNAAVRLSFFILISLFLSSLKELGREKEIARLDYLTGAVNRRLFFEILQRELDRYQRYRHPFSIVYIDIDNFKTVNDQKGHKIGDKLLRVVVTQITRFLRKTDTIARLGGDEFALLLTEVDQSLSKVIVTRIQLALLDEMKKSNLPVTFSIGVLTCLDARISPDEMVTKADELMYKVKKNGKNAIAYGTYPS